MELKEKQTVDSNRNHENYSYSLNYTERSIENKGGKCQI